MREANIILTAIVQADGKLKNRPALVLRKMPKYGDLLICEISTQIRQYTPNFDEIIREEDLDFKNTGLIQTSIVRLAFLAIVQERDIIGTIGSISHERHQKLLSNLANYLLSSTKSELV